VSWYAPRPEFTLTDWLSDMRRAHAALPGEDIQIDRILAPATLEGLRDRALLSVLLYHGLRREELCLLTVRDIHPRRGVPQLRVHGNGGNYDDLAIMRSSTPRTPVCRAAIGHAVRS
jgi:integrase